MTYFVIPSRRTRQPQRPARLNESSCLLNGVYDVWSAHNNWIGCRTGRQFSIPASATKEVTPEGWQFTKLNGSSSLNLTGVAGLNHSTSPRSLFVLCRTADTKDAFDVAFTGDSASYPASRIQLSSTGTQWMGSDVQYDNIGGTAAVSTTYQIGYAIEGSTVNDHLYVNGAVVSTNTTGRADYTIDRLYIGGYKGQDGAWWNGSVGIAIWWNKFLSTDVFAELQRNPWQIFAPDSRRIYFGASGGGATTITTSGAASLVARAAAAVTATKTATASSRAAITSAASATSIRTSALVAKANSAGAAATTTIRTATIAARTAGTGTAATTTLRTGIAAGRIASNAQTTYAAIIAGAFTAAGRTSARGAAAYASTHTATAAATATTSGAAAATTLREGIAVARVDARAAVTAAALVAGTITTTAAAQISARASVSNTTERSAALAAMLALRGANPAAPELPVIVPPSTRTLSPDHARLGLSPVAPAKPRLG